MKIKRKFIIWPRAVHLAEGDKFGYFFGGYAYIYNGVWYASEISAKAARAIRETSPEFKSEEYLNKIANGFKN